MLKDDLFAKLLSECFGSMRKSVTFASAFELKVRAKQSEIPIGRRQDKGRVLWKDLHKTDKVVQEAKSILWWVDFG